MKMRTILAAAAVLCLAAGCVKEEQGIVDVPAGSENEIFADAPKIMAELSEPETRTCIEAAADATGKLPMLWEESDAVGVFFADGSSNAKYVNISGKNPNAAFGAAEQVSGSEIAYVYYPYSAANNGKAATALSGNVPAEQAMDGSIHGDYKWGELRDKVDGGYKFKFHNIVSLVRFNIDASGTVLAGEKLETVTLTVTRDGAAVPVVGDFTFSAADGNYTLGAQTSNTLTTVWNKDASGIFSGYASILPEVKSGDKLTFVIKTTNYESTLTVTSKANFAAGAYYNFPLTLSKFSALKIQKTIRGNFTAASHNVDGIGLSLINGDGPGSSGTKNISSKIAASNWDFVAFSEDFSYHSELMSNMSGFTFGSYTGDIESYTSALFGKVYDIDGLCFATRNTTCSFANETRVRFDKSAGGVTQGANTCVKKSFRYYLLTLSDGVQIDVIITHMNTYGSGDRYNAQHAQLQQVANYITSNLKSNNRPIIFMGDTNLRYTRHDFEKYFWSILREAGLTYSDPWVEFQWNNVYPTYPSGSLMVNDLKDSEDLSDTDIICSTTQNGEVVDKIIYINNPNANTTIKALSYLRDYDGFNSLGDHMPVVAEFSYESVVNVK